MKILFKIILLLLLFRGNAIAQADSIRDRDAQPKYSLRDKIYFGGNIGVQFGTSTFLAISPLVGYKFTPKFSAGIGLTYQYFHYKDKTYNLETNVYGGRVFGRYMITENFFGHAEYEYLNLEAFDFFPTRRVDVGSLLAGVGYIQRFGRSSGIVAMVLYNFTESAYTPYQNPVIRIGVNFGL